MCYCLLSVFLVEHPYRTNVVVDAYQGKCSQMPTKAMLVAKDTFILRMFS